MTTPIIDLTRDADGVVPQTVTLTEPWLLDVGPGKLTIDDLLDMTPAEAAAWVSDPTTTYAQQTSMMALLDDPAVRQYARFRHYRDDPVGFVFDILREHIWSVQREVMESVRDHRRTSVPSCHSAGKSFVASCIVAHWIATHAPGDAFVVTTAPTMTQVRSVLWRYINRMHSGGHLPGRTNLAQWYIGGELVAIGRKPADTNPAAFQGLHARYLLVIIDEADGVHGDIYGALQTLTTNETSRILAIGNPDMPAGRFFDANMPGSGWHTIRISAYNTPNFNSHPLRTVPDEPDVPVTVLENLVDPSWVADVIADPHYGQDSAYYRSKVLAMPPEDSPSAVIPLSALRLCMPHPDVTERLVRWDPTTMELLAGADLGPVEIGLDVGAGGDMTVARERRGAVLGRVFRVKDEDTMRQVPKIVAFIRLTGATVVKVDSIGIGKGLYDRLRELKQAGAIDARIVGVNVGRNGRKSTARRPGFPKLRDQLWWEVGRANTLDQEWDLSALHDEDWVLPELYQPTFSEMLNGQTKIESKDEMKKRLGHSPDDADAILLAYVKSSTGHANADQLMSARI